MQWGSVIHQMAVPVPSISCCILNHHNLFYQIQNVLAFDWDTCCHLALCLQLIPFYCIGIKIDSIGVSFYFFSIYILFPFQSLPLLTPINIIQMYFSTIVTCKNLGLGLISCVFKLFLNWKRFHAKLYWLQGMINN